MKTKPDDKETAILSNVNTVLRKLENPEKSSNDTTLILIELVSYLGDLLSYYQDKIAEEAYVSTARKRVSISRAARLLDYFMKYDAGFEFVALSNGEANQSFSIKEESNTVWIRETLDVEEESAKIRDNNVEIMGYEGWRKWSSVSDFSGSGPDDRCYTIDRVSGIIKFGDGKRGMIPPVDSIIRASYRVGIGANDQANLCKSDRTYLEELLGIPSTRYGDILQAGRLVNLRGLGSSFSGVYYVEPVTHTITSVDYRTKFNLTRKRKSRRKASKGPRSRARSCKCS